MKRMSTEQMIIVVLVLYIVMNRENMYKSSEDTLN